MQAAEKNKKMKKKLVLLLTAIMAVSVFCSCGNKEEKPQESSQVQASDSSDSTQKSENAGNDTAIILKDRDVENYVTLGEYKGISVTAPAATVSEENLNAMVMQMYNSFVTAENGGITDRAVKNEDTVNISYVGKKDDVAFDGGTADGTLLTIGSNSYIDGFETGLIGVMPGETVDLNLTFPENYGNEELAGADVVFTVTVNFIMPSEMKDEVIVSMGAAEFSNVEELNQYVNDYMSEIAESDRENQIKSSVINTFITNCKFEELPEDLVEKYETNIRNNIGTSAFSSGVDEDTYCYYNYGMDFESFVSDYAQQAAKQGLALQALANTEGLNIEDEELNTMLEEYAADGGYNNVEEMIGSNSLEDYREYFMFEKVADYLVSNAVVTES